MTRREHPARAAAHRADRKIFATIRATYDVDYAHPPGGEYQTGSRPLSVSEFRVVVVQ